MQDWAKEHDLEWRVHLSFNQQAIGSTKRTNRILKYQINLLTRKTALAGRLIDVLPQALIHFSDQLVVLVPHVPDRGPLRRRPVP